MARLFLRVGRRDGVRPADIVGAIANEAGVPGQEIGDIDLYEAFSFVEVPAEAAQTVLDALNRTTIRGRETRATIAQPDGEGRDRDRGRGLSDGERRRDRDSGDDSRVRRVSTGPRRVRPGERRDTDRPFRRPGRSPRDYR